MTLRAGRVKHGDEDGWVGGQGMVPGLKRVCTGAKLGSQVQAKEKARNIENHVRALLTTAGIDASDRVSEGVWCPLWAPSKRMPPSNGATARGGRLSKRARRPRAEHDGGKRGRVTKAEKDASRHSSCPGVRWIAGTGWAASRVAEDLRWKEGCGRRRRVIRAPS
jgi:hypothetical protein